jgi:hypothetical protein
MPPPRGRYSRRGRGPRRAEPRLHRCAKRERGTI